MFCVTLLACPRASISTHKWGTLRATLWVQRQLRVCDFHGVVKVPAQGWNVLADAKAGMGTSLPLNVTIRLARTWNLATSEKQGSRESWLSFAHRIQGDQHLFFCSKGPWWFPSHGLFIHGFSWLFFRLVHLFLINFLILFLGTFNLLGG